jgi:FKBP12-rapamycin complex-associated protein
VSGAAGPQSLSASAMMTGDAGILVGGVPLLARIYLKLGTWRWTLSSTLDDDAISGILSSLRAATESARGWAKAWHKWALFNTAVMSHHTLMGAPASAARHVVAAVDGYFRSIALGSANQKGGDGSLQVGAAA